MTDLTVANSAFTLEVASVFPAPIPIEGYSADDAFDTDSVAPNEVMTGVDGDLSGGYVYVPVKLKFTLQANSPSIIFLETWYESMKTNNTSYTANASIVAPSLGKIWTFTKGFLTGYKVTPNAKKLMQAQAFEITFKKCTSAVGALAASLV
jgi:hypothetical protein